MEFSVMMITISQVLSTTPKLLTRIPYTVTLCITYNSIQPVLVPAKSLNQYDSCIFNKKLGQ